jgi:hypothetical protein
MKITKKKKNNIQIHSIICPYLFFFLLVHGVYRVAGGWLFNLTREKDCKNKKKKKAFAATVVSWYWCSYVS